MDPGHRSIVRPIIWGVYWLVFAVFVVFYKYVDSWGSFVWGIGVGLWIGMQLIELQSVLWWRRRERRIKNKQQG